MYEASSETRNATAFEISSALPNRARGMASSNLVRWSSPSAEVMSVSINPGATAFTVIPREAISSARDYVNPIRPALLAA